MALAPGHSEELCGPEGPGSHSTLHRLRDGGHVDLSPEARLVQRVPEHRLGGGLQPPEREGLPEWPWGQAKLAHLGAKGLDWLRPDAAVVEGHAHLGLGPLGGRRAHVAHELAGRLGRLFGMVGNLP